MKILKTLDTLALLAVCFSLLTAFFFQLVLGELPCALCNLERVGFLIFGAGLAMNLRYGVSPWNYVLSGFGALVGALTALLQMFVHAPPGTPPTGTAFLGLHMYTWSFAILTLAPLYCLIAIALYASSFAAAQDEPAAPRAMSGSALIFIFTLLVAANFISAFLENGFHPFMGGGQQHYRLLYSGDVMKP